MKKFLVGLLALGSVSVSANCNLVINLDQESDFNLLPKIDCPSCGERWYRNRERKKDIRKNKLKDKIAKTMENKNFIYINDSTAAEYKLDLYAYTIDERISKHRLIGHLKVKAVLSDNNGILEEIELPQDYNFYKSDFRDILSSLNKAVRLMNTSCE